jgi:hypothetical protein
MTSFAFSSQRIPVHTSFPSVAIKSTFLNSVPVWKVNSRVSLSIALLGSHEKNQRPFLGAKTGLGSEKNFWKEMVIIIKTGETITWDLKAQGRGLGMIVSGFLYGPGVGECAGRVR